MSVNQKDIPFLTDKLTSVHHKWELFGQQLGLLPSVIKKIKEDATKHTDLSQCFNDALESWMAMNDEEHSWQAIYKALKLCGNTNLAEKLHTNHEKEFKADALEEKHISVILKELQPVVHIWFDFCLQLNVPISRLQQIGSSLTCTKCFSLMLAKWVEVEGKNATVENILKVLGGPVISNSRLASDLKKLNIEELLVKNAKPRKNTEGQVEVPTSSIDRPAQMVTQTDGGTPEEDMPTVEDTM